MSGSAMLSAVYGYEVTSAHDPLVKIIETGWGHMSQAAVFGSKQFQPLSYSSHNDYFH